MRTHGVLQQIEDQCSCLPRQKNDTKVKGLTLDGARLESKYRFCSFLIQKSSVWMQPATAARTFGVPVVPEV